MQSQTIHYEERKLDRLKNFYISSLRSRSMTIDSMLCKSILESHGLDRYWLDRLHVAFCQILMDSLREILLCARHANILTRRARSKDQSTRLRAFLLLIRLFLYVLRFNLVHSLMNNFLYFRD